MKQQISGPVGIAIGVIIIAVLIGFLYKQFFYEKKISPEETRAMMQKHMSESGGH